MPSLLQVSAGESDLATDQSTIEATTGLANITATFVDASGNPLVGATEVSLASTGTGNTITAVSTQTSAAGVYRWTFASTVAEAKTLTATAAGLNVTQTVAVTVSGEAPVGPTLAWAQDWPTTGETEAAVLGESGVSPFETWIGGADSGASVVNATSDGVGTGAPATNALRIDLVYIGGGVQNIDTSEVSLEPSGGGWATPAVGESIYFRVYKHFVYPNVANPAPLGNNNHCLEQSGGSGNTWSWNFNTAAGGWCPSFNRWVSGTPTRFQLGGGSTYLARDVWYRLEWRIHRTATDAYETEIRIYDAAGVLRYSDADFTAGATVLTDYSGAFGTSGVAELDRWQLGTNGPNIVGSTVGCAPAWYFAAAAVSVTDWCGPYISGEGPE